MSEISILRGDVLRIRSGRLLLVLRPGSACEVRIVKRGLGVRLARALMAAGRRFLQARREDAQARQLAQLDPRILKDIGLEPHRGGSLAERVHGYRRAELLRAIAGRFGV